MASKYLLFEASSLTMAVPAELIRAVHEELAVQVVAGTRKWFLGLSVVHGKLLPVTDMGAFAGRRSSTGRTLELADSAGIGAFQVDTVFGLSNAPITNVPMNDREVAQANDSNLALSTRAVVFDERTHRLLDVAALVQSPAYLNIAENSH